MPFTVCGSRAAFLFALQGVFALWGVFFLSVYVNICGDTLRSSNAIFGGSPLVFSVRGCALSVGFVFVMLCNGSNFVRVAFCLLFGISYRLIFPSLVGGLFWF